MLSVRHDIDKADGEVVMIITCENGDQFNSIAMFRKKAKEVINFKQEKITNHSIVFTTDELEEARNDRAFIIFWSDVCKLMRDKKVIIYTYKGEWLNNDTTTKN